MEGFSLRISIRLDEAVTATTFDPIAEAIRFITGEQADLGRIIHTTAALIFLANQDLIACQHRIFRLCCADCASSSVRCAES